jgi:RNA polymerase sigma-70 factor (sigma-E family)
VYPTFEEFVADQLTSILRYAAALSGDPALAEDMVQEALFRAQRRWRRVAGMDRPDLYVRRIVLNEYLGWRRRRVSRDVSMPADAVDRIAPAAQDGAGTRGDQDAVRRALAQLPRQQRAVLVLRYFEGLSVLEIAEVLGCGSGTVRSHASRGIASLRASLGPVFVDEETR